MDQMLVFNETCLIQNCLKDVEFDKLYCLIELQ